MSIGVESMPKDGLEDDFMKFWGDRTRFLLITNAFEKNYPISLRCPPIDLRRGVHLEHQSFLLCFYNFYGEEHDV